MRDSDLHAYVDGQLDPAQRVEVEAWLSANQEAMRRVEAYRLQIATLHRLFDPVLAAPPDDRLSRLGQTLEARLSVVAGRRRRWDDRWWLRAAASVAVVVAALGTGWFGHARLSGPAPVTVLGPNPLSFAEEAAQAHTFYVHSRFEVEMGADDQEALNAWLSERLGRPVVAPDLTSTGYRLIGGRSLPTDGGTVAQYMFQTEDGARLTLLVGLSQNGPETAFGVVKRDDIASFYWNEGLLSYALVGRLDRDRLTSIAKTAYRMLKTAGPGPRPAAPPGQSSPEAKPAATAPADQPASPPAQGDQGQPKAS